MANINNFMTRFILISILISVVASILLICQSKILCKYKEEHIYLVWILVYIGFYLPFIPPIVSLPKIKMLMDLGIEVEKQKNMPVFFEAVTEMNGENFIPFSVILFLIWILGMIIKGIVIIKKRYQFYRYIEILSMKENELRKLKCFLKIKERMRVKKEVCLIRCSVIGSPFVYYHKRFYVVLPDMAFHDDEMELIFCHEFAHIQRNDIFLNRFQEISGVLFWFNPLLPFIKKEFDIIREVMCDKSVIRILGYTSNIEYAERLLIISKDILRKKEKYIKQYILTSFALKSIEERVTMLLGEKTKNIYCSLLPILMIVFIVSNGIQGNGIQGRTDSGKLDYSQ